MTCLQALLDVMDPFGLLVIFTDLGVFPDRGFDVEWRATGQ
jgi:hypothetical protein